jgi:hypothetical protein
MKLDSNNGLPITKNVIVYADYESPTIYYEQYFCNLSFKFKPTFKNVTETYRIEITILGYGEWMFNTDTSTQVRNNSYAIQFQSSYGQGYKVASYSDKIYALTTKTGHFETNNFYCNTFNKTILENFNYNTGQGGGSNFTYTFPTGGLYLVTCGENYNDINLLDVFYIYAGKGNYTNVRYIYDAPLTTVSQTGASSFTINANAPSGYTSFSISYQKIN